jgi:alpha-ketoglutarate-dependent taurine dioxygenase
MVNYKLHNNGWTVIIDDFDLRTATQDNINHIARLIATNTLVVIKNQSLTIKDEIKIARMFKDPQCFNIHDDPGYISDMTGCEINESEGLFLRVTGEKDEYGRTGIAGHVNEMIWHSHSLGNSDDRPIVWLYGVRGTKGSRTTWNNNIMSYNDLDDKFKDKINNYHLEILSEAGLEYGNPDKDQIISNHNPPMVAKNISGQTGLFFPFLQIVKIKELSNKKSREIINWLGPFTVQEKYCYHHDWNDGDVVLSEQTLGMHKRWRFEKIDHRLLHIGAFKFPDQDYKN